MESLQKAKDPVVTYTEALALPFVGPTIAKMIVPPEKTPRRPAQQPSFSGASPDAGESCITRQVLPNNPHVEQSRKRPLDVEKKSKKQLAVEQAQARALQWKNQRMVWRVVLLIDVREQERNKMRSACQQSGIPTEERTLPIGDMAWIAQGTQGGQVVEELLVGTIVERKSAEDLKASLFGTRYMEQRKRLKETGITQVVFLIEGDITKDQHRCPADTLLSALWEIRLHTGFQILQTKHMDDTVVTLKRMHRRILQRTFPAVFSLSEALPNFNQVALRADLPSDERDILAHNRRRRRKRMQSLMEMTFDCDPTPPFGTQRFMTYSELKAIVERDREITNRRVGSLHGFMLKQVNTVNAKKIVRLQEIYPTTCHLLEAYDSCPKNQRCDLLSEVVVSEGARTSKIGPRSSAELHVAYGLAMRDDESLTRAKVTQPTNSLNQSSSLTAAAQFAKENTRPPTGQSVAIDPSQRNEKSVSVSQTGPVTTLYPGLSRDPIESFLEQPPVPRETPPPYATQITKLKAPSSESFLKQPPVPCEGSPPHERQKTLKAPSREKPVILMLDDDSDDTDDELRPAFNQTAPRRANAKADVEVIEID